MKELTATIKPLVRSGVDTTPTDQAPQFKAYRDPLIEIVLPVLNEQQTLEGHVKKLDTFMSERLPYRYRITIADNGSIDQTQTIARKLSQEIATVRTVRLTQRGRGRALKKVWAESPADILTYMDVDLSTSLDDFVPLIQPLVSGHAGVAIGSRLKKGAKTTRGFKREFISRTCNKIIKCSSRTHFSDALVATAKDLQL